MIVDSIPQKHVHQCPSPAASPSFCGDQFAPIRSAARDRIHPGTRSITSLTRSNVETDSCLRRSLRCGVAASKQDLPWRKKLPSVASANKAAQLRRMAAQLHRMLDSSQCYHTLVSRFGSLANSESSRSSHPSQRCSDRFLEADSADRRLWLRVLPRFQIGQC